MPFLMNGRYVSFYTFTEDPSRSKSFLQIYMSSSRQDRRHEQRKKIKQEKTTYFELIGFKVI